MAPRVVNGWLFDIYPSAQGVTLWIIDREGVRHCVYDRFHPSFYLHVSDAGAREAAAITQGFSIPVSFARARQRELYTNQELDVVCVEVHDALQLKSVVQRLERHFPHYVFFNSDIPVPQLYLYHTGLFPLAYGEYIIDENGRLSSWALSDSYDALEYSMPEFSVMNLRNRPDIVSPKHRTVFQLELTYDGVTHVLESEDTVDVLQALNRHLHRCDPDIIMTAYGDAVLLPMLTRLAAEEGVPLSLNRDPAAGYCTTQGTSYFSYGRIVHKDGAFTLAGRWHLDTENSFMMGEASLDGVAEIARLTRLPVQHQSRASIGSALSSMQLSWAYTHGYLIPARKREPEGFKSAETLLLADRGGLIFQPDMGYHEQVAELDFVSMYPTIMVEHNVSPETVNCSCCHNEAVPELRYTICERREGIVPATLRTVVRKRGIYKKHKKRLKALGDERWHIYDRRQNALKWMLVTCFGYLGYKNARFGRIEAHESVNAFSRDAILLAKETAERRGYHLLHAIVDCMWLHREGATEADYELLAREVSAAAGIDISLEGIYRWILFPPSKMDPRLPTANRYVGWYTNNDIKIRGIELRRRDTPVFIKHLQGDMLKVFGRAMTVRDLEHLIPETLDLARTALQQLRAGSTDPLELVIRRHVSRETDEYTHRTVNAEAARALEEAGIHLAPGEMAEYIMVDATGTRIPEKARPLPLYAFEDGYDIEYYTGLTLKAVETLLFPFGYDVERLKEVCAVPQRRRRRQPPAPPRQPSLFEPEQ